MTMPSDEQIRAVVKYNRLEDRTILLKEDVWRTLPLADWVVELVKSAAALASHVAQQRLVSNRLGTEEALVRVEELLYQDYGDLLMRNRITERLRQVSQELEDKRIAELTRKVEAGRAHPSKLRRGSR